MKNRQQHDEDEFPDDGKEEAVQEEEREELPPITTVSIDVVDGRGIRYHGAFVYKVPNMRDTMEIGRRKSQLLPVSVINDTNAIMIAEMIAYLDVTLQKGDRPLPKWWKPLEFYDETPIVALYSEVTAYAMKFRGEKPRPNAHGTAGADEEAPAGDGGSAVDGDVPPPVERRTVHRTAAAGSASAGASRRSDQG
jgi:hypothetical protein